MITTQLNEINHFFLHSLPEGLCGKKSTFKTHNEQASGIQREDFLLLPFYFTMYTYSRNEKLKKQKLVDALFQKRKSVNAFPVKAFYAFSEEKLDCPLKAGVGTSKRNFKKAVDRNRVKRLLREAWRLHKAPLKELLDSNQQQMTVFLHYSDTVLPTQELTNEKVRKIVHKLIQAANENHTQNR
ncbi:MAG: ribonuclease P protein component [Chitinophagaceae bacterium]